MCSTERLKILCASTTGLVQLSYHACGLWLRQNKTAHETFSWEMSCKMKKGGN